MNQEKRELVLEIIIFILLCIVFFLIGYELGTGKLSFNIGGLLCQFLI